MTNAPTGCIKHTSKMLVLQKDAQAIKISDVIQMQMCTLYYI